MRPSISRSLTIAAILTIIGLAAAAAPAQTWDAVADFSTTQNPAGAWSYGWMPTGSTTAFSAYPLTVATCGLSGWIHPSIPATCVLKTDQPVAATCSTLTVQPNFLDVHPGPGGEYAVVRWTAPATASYNVAIGVIGFDFYFPTSTDAHLRFNGSPLYSVNVSSYGNLSMFSAVVQANAGDTVDLAVGPGPNGYVGDSTGVQMTITTTCLLPASALTIGIGCGGAPANPHIDSTPPALGTTATISITQAPANAFGQVFAGPPAAQPYILASGCPIFLDVNSAFPAYQVATDATGHWSVQQPIPGNPSLIGFVIALQAYLVPAPSSYGYALTNTLALTIGC